MKKFIIYLLVIVVTTSLMFTGCGGAGTKDKTVQDKLQNCVKSYSDNNKFLGTVLVVKDDKVLLKKGYGMADGDKHISNSPQTIFEIGTLTTTFTATAIMMLQEKNLLSVQDTVNKYIPDYINKEIYFYLC